VLWLRAHAAASLQPPVQASTSAGTVAPPAEREAMIQHIMDALVQQSLISGAEAADYLMLWRQLGAYRQEAAEALLVEALMRQANVGFAVQHVRQVLQQNLSRQEDD
jgi:hypothetical protein